MKRAGLVCPIVLRPSKNVADESTSSVNVRLVRGLAESDLSGKLVAAKLNCALAATVSSFSTALGMSINF